MTDPIADMLTRLRNAVHARHPRVDVPTSRLKAEIARILEREGYIQGFKMVEPADGGAHVRGFQGIMRSGGREDQRLDQPEPCLPHALREMARQLGEVAPPALAFAHAAYRQRRAHPRSSSLTQPRRSP